MLRAILCDMHFSPTTLTARFFSRLCWIIVGCACAAALQAQTVSIPGLFRTGVNNSGNRLGENVVDAHYVVTAIPSNAPADNLGASYTVRNSALPGGWVAAPGSATSGSRWITTPGTATSGLLNGNDPSRVSNGNFDYTLTFTMPAGAILSTVSITGAGAADNSAQIFVNGVLVSGQSILGSGSTNSFTLTGANASFQVGNNTIRFRVFNNVTDTGLLISSLSGTVSVPEVGTVLPLIGAIGLYALGLWRRRQGPNT